MNVVTETLADFAIDSPLYGVRHPGCRQNDLVPFRVGVEPFTLTADQSRQLSEVGIEAAVYFLAVQELYQEDEVVHELLDRHKPKELKNRGDFNYLFVRPDLVVNEDGFTLCEIETSAFGLSLTDILNRSFQAAGQTTMTGTDDLRDYLHEATPPEGQIIYSFKTQAFNGQLRYMAKNLLSQAGQREWKTVLLGSQDTERYTAFYRGFYMSEFDDDIFARDFISKMVGNEDQASVLPGLSSQMEEKAVLAFIWDKRYQKYFLGQLGKAALELLQRVIPPTWIMGQEEYFMPGLPSNIPSSIALSGLSKAKRHFVLKASGGRNCSWGTGVSFLHKKSGKQVAESLKGASRSDGLFVIQAFRRGKDFSVAYETDDSVAVEEKARVRITPYFALRGNNFGKLLAIKATARAGTEFIHGSTDSINAAVNTV